MIEASTTGFVAECYMLHATPAFGSLVRTHAGDLAIYAVAASATTASIDPGRKASARGLTELTEDDLYNNNPELLSLLRTTFDAVCVGFAEAPVPAKADRSVLIRQYLPPCPPHVHGFVYQCSPVEVRLFTERLDCLANLLASGQRGVADELVAAFVRHAGRARAADTESAERAYLIDSGKELASLLSADVARLNAILRRIRV